MASTATGAERSDACPSPPPAAEPTEDPAGVSPARARLLRARARLSETKEAKAESGAAAGEDEEAKKAAAKKAVLERLKKRAAARKEAEGSEA